MLEFNLYKGVFGMDFSNEFMSLEQAMAVVEEVKKRTGQTAYSIVLNKDKEPDIFDSKFGGTPYWDMTKEYPVGSEGEKMLLLAQLNFDKLKTDDRFPDKGMLQFFISMDDMYGWDDEESDVQKDFRVIYHENIDYSMEKDKIMELGIPCCTDSEMKKSDTPIHKEVVIDVQKTESYMFNNYDFPKMYHQIIKEKFDYECLEDELLYDLLQDDDFEKVADELSKPGSQMFGYPFFTQYDPRENNEEYQRYDTLLLQIDTTINDDNGEYYVMWGDSGVGNFFINSEDLKNRDFSKILYNWDCM